MLKHDIKKGIVIYQKPWSHHLFDAVLWLPLPIAIISAIKIIYQRHFMNLVKHVGFNNFINKINFIGIPMLIVSSLLIIPKILQFLVKSKVDRSMLLTSNPSFKSKIDKERRLGFYNSKVEHKLTEGNDNYYKYKFYQVKTHDGIALDSFISTNLENVRKAEENNQAERYVIYFNGNDTLYQFHYSNYDNTPHSNFMSDTISHDILFNYRGTGNSSGNPCGYADLVNDGIAQVDYLLKQGVKPENIELYGHSMGGGIAPHVAMHFHKRGIKLGGMILSRTYSDLIESIKYHIKTLPHYLVKLIVENSGWNNNVIDTVIELLDNKMPISLIDIKVDYNIGPKCLAKELFRRRPEYKDHIYTSDDKNHYHNTDIEKLGADRFIEKHFTHVAPTV